MEDFVLSLLLSALFFKIASLLFCKEGERIKQQRLGWLGPLFTLEKQREISKKKEMTF